MLVTPEDFDWSLTDRELVIFLPNWGRADFIRQVMPTIKTSISKDRWIVLVGNDRQHEDLSDLADQNVVYFTFEPDAKREQYRGGGFIRNIAIKNSRSKWFFQKDPEVIIEGDFIANVIACPTDFYRLGGPAFRVRPNITTKFMKNQATVEDCRQDADRHQIGINNFVFFNFAYGVKTQVLKDMRGYDEDFGGTYCYDRDMYYRLMAQGIKTTMDEQCHPIHLWHPTPSFPDTPETRQEYEDMKRMFAGKDPNQIVRNDPKTWGKGG